MFLKNGGSIKYVNIQGYKFVVIFTTRKLRTLARTIKYVYLVSFCSFIHLFIFGFLIPKLESD